MADSSASTAAGIRSTMARAEEALTSTPMQSPDAELEEIFNKLSLTPIEGSQLPPGFEKDDVVGLSKAISDAFVQKNQVNASQQSQITILKVTRTLLRYQTAFSGVGSTLSSPDTILNVYIPLLRPSTLANATVRDEALKCINNALFGGDVALRSQVSEHPKLVDSLRKNVVPLLDSYLAAPGSSGTDSKSSPSKSPPKKSPSKSPKKGGKNQQSASADGSAKPLNVAEHANANEIGRLFRVLLILFQDAGTGASKCAAASGALLDSGVVASTIHAITRSFYSCVVKDPSKAPKETAASASSPAERELVEFSPEKVSISIENRILLSAGLKLIYAIAMLNTKAMAKTLMQNEERDPCVPEELAEAEISPRVEPIRGIGDLFAFLSLHVLCATPASTGSAGVNNDDDSLRDVQNQIASISTMAEEVPGYSKYLFHMGAIKAMAQSLERRLEQATPVNDGEQEIRTISQAAAYEYLIPYLMAMDTLARDYSLALEYLRSEVVFPPQSRLPPIDPEAFSSQEEFNEAMEARKVDGATRKDTFGGKLTMLMVSLETSLKRLAGEFLWTLCHDSAKEMTDLCGYGAAAHMIAIKAGTIGQIHKSDTVAQMKGGA